MPFFTSSKSLLCPQNVHVTFWLHSLDICFEPVKKGHFFRVIKNMLFLCVPFRGVESIHIHYLSKSIDTRV